MDELTTLIGASFDQRVGGRNPSDPTKTNRGLSLVYARAVLEKSGTPKTMLPNREVL